MGWFRWLPGMLFKAEVLSLNLYPLSRLRGFLHGLEHTLIAHSILERRLDRLALDHGIHEVGDGMNKGVLVADDMAGRPPLSDVRVNSARLRHQNIAEALP